MISPADASAPDMASPAARRGLLAVSAVATGLLVWLAVRTVDLEETWRAIRASDAAWTLPSLALLAIAVWLRAVRWWGLFVPARRAPRTVTRFPYLAAAAVLLVASRRRSSVAGSARIRP